MRDEILKRLIAIEKEENIKILYACESGSRAWGFPSKDSDYDVRFVYVRDVDWYLRVDHEFQRDVVERPINDLLDINGWDLKKALKLLKKSNPALVEWVNSPIVYRADEEFAAGFGALVSEYYCPRACFYHYMHMAKNNNREFLKGDLVKPKKYFYVLRPIFAMMWIERDMGVVPMRFEDLMDGVLDDSELRAEIEKLLENKRAGFETAQIPRLESINRFIETELKRLEDVTQTIPKNEAGAEAMNRFFLDVLNKQHA